MLIKRFYDRSLITKYSHLFHFRFECDEIEIFVTLDQLFCALRVVNERGQIGHKILMPKKLDIKLGPKLGCSF